MTVTIRTKLVRTGEDLTTPVEVELGADEYIAGVQLTPEGKFYALYVATKEVSG